MGHLDDLQAFVSVVDTGGFTPAARALSRSRSSISRAVSRLEERLGVLLLQRTTRRVGLTPAGEEYCAEVRPLLAGLEQADARMMARRATPSGRLRLSAPMAFGSVWLAPVLAAFQEAWPRVSLDVLYTDEKVDLAAEGVDLALRGGTRLERNHVARRLWPFELVPVASPAYLERRGRPRVPGDLDHHDCLVYLGSQPVGTWALERGDEAVTAQVSGPRRSDAAADLVAAARAGLGITLLPEWATCDALEAGELEVVLPAWTGGHAWFWSIRQARTLQPARMRVLLDHLAAAYTEPPWRRWRAGLRDAGAHGDVASPSRG